MRDFKLAKLKELAGQNNVGTLVAALAALSEAAEPRVPPSPAAGYSKIGFSKGPVLYDLLLLL